MSERIKPIAGQLSLLGDPPVKYCRRCQRLLRGEQSRVRGLGPICFRKSKPKRRRRRRRNPQSPRSTAGARTEAVTTRPALNGGVTKE